MKQNNSSDFSSLVIYEVFPRNHGPKGTLRDIGKDLPRIKALGVDVVWLMPIHPLGKIKKKGTLGSPYAISNFREVNPDLGTKDDLRSLCDAAHAIGLKVIIDVVYHHTSPDSILVQEHPEWFYHDQNGKPYPRVADWYDVVDLDFDQRPLWDYLIETLLDWIRLGVDGFRCDVASLVPMEFWKKARGSVDQIKPGCIFLAETVHTSFVLEHRRRGDLAHADCEAYQVFDITYDYDVWEVWKKAVKDPEFVPLYISLLSYQKGTLPEGELKLRCVENHDQPRIMHAASSRAQALAWTAFQAFNEGVFLIFAGQESGAKRAPGHFELDPIEWDDYEFSSYLKILCNIRKKCPRQRGYFSLLSAEPAVTALWQGKDEAFFGIFNVSGNKGEIKVPLPDGSYRDLISEESVDIKEGKLLVPLSALILKANSEIDIGKYPPESILL